MSQKFLTPGYRKAGQPQGGILSLWAENIIFLDTLTICITNVYQRTYMRMFVAASFVIANRVFSYSYGGITGIKLILLKGTIKTG